ncbi:MAG: hypothetical protein ACUVQ1_00660 [Candidatus Kapaibacteriales bacterium]
MKRTCKIILLFGFVLSSCTIVNKFAGADIDPEQFDLACKARMLEVKYNGMEKQLKYVARSNEILNSDFVFKINESLLNKLAEQYENVCGWLDDENSFFIKSTKISLNFGSAIGSISLIAHNYKHNVDVNLVTDCIVEFEKSEALNNLKAIPKLKMKLIPYNINVDVSSSGILAYFKEIVQNLVKINLANLENSLPPIEIPLEFENKIEMPSIRYVNKEKVNFVLFTYKQKIEIKINLKDILILDGFAIITGNLLRFDLGKE